MAGHPAGLLLLSAHGKARNICFVAQTSSVLIFREARVNTRSQIAVKKDVKGMAQQPAAEMQL